MLKKYGLHLAWVVAIIGMISTLYLSTVLEWPVCHLCWYQRLCLYPLVLLLGIACFRQDHRIWIYAIPFSLLGALFSLYQYLQQMIPGFEPIRVCGLGPDCRFIHLKWAGFITLPFLGLIAFLVITFLLLLSRKRENY